MDSRLRRERGAFEASQDDMDFEWLSEDDDDDDDAESTEALARSASPPATVSPHRWEQYKAAVAARGFHACAPARPELPIGRGVPVHTSPDVLRAIEHPNTRCLNVRQPWASLIAWGVKDVENRTTPIPHNTPEDVHSHCWVAVVASQHTLNAKQWEKTMRDAERRVYWNDGYRSMDLPRIPRLQRDYPAQTIVAFAKMRCSLPTKSGERFVGKQTAWNNGDAYAWEILEVHPVLVPFGKGYQTPLVYLNPKPNNPNAGFFAGVRAAMKRALSLDAPSPPKAQQPSPPKAQQPSPPKARQPSPPKAQQPSPPKAPSASATSVVFDTLNRLGCATMVCPNVITADFLHKLDLATRSWFYSQLDAAVREKGGASATRWLSVYTPEDRKAVLTRFDPSTTTGLHRIFDDKSRRAALPDDLREFLDGCIRYVKMGNSNMGLAAMHRSWSMKGFGLWARINPGIGLEITTQVVQLLRDGGFRVNVDDALPHLIYKPPNGEKLAPHHDQMTAENLVRNLEAHVNSSDPSMLSWALKHGMQTLCHIEGGRMDGYTYVIGPMTPVKLLVCMKALVENRIPLAFKDGATQQGWKRAVDGPYFANWLAALPALNRELQRHGFDEVRELPVRPSGTDGVGAYVAMWPVGMPHGSSTNKTRRVTVTLPLRTTATPPLAEGARSRTRLKAIATLAATSSDLEEGGFYNGTPEQQKRNAREFLERDTTPYHDGRTHKKPEYAITYVDRDGGAHYASIAPTLSQARKYLRLA